MASDLEIAIALRGDTAQLQSDMLKASQSVADSAARMESANSKAWKKIESDSKKSAQSIESTFKSAATGIQTAFAGALGVGLIKGIYDNVAEAQTASAQLGAALKSTQGAAGLTAQELNNMAQEMKNLTAIDDDAVTGMQSVLLTFTKVGKEVFPQASEAIADLSARLGQDMQSSAVQVGKALNDPIKGVTALQRVGVSFTESQKDMIKHLVETGQTLDAQKIILKELETEFGGSAIAARDTLGGALQALQVRVGDMFQALGGEGGSLRYGLEVSITALEKLNGDIESFQKTLNDGTFAATDMGKAMSAAWDLGGKGLNILYYGLNEAVSVTSELVNGFNATTAALGRLFETTGAFKSAISDLSKLGGGKNPFQSWFDGMADIANGKGIKKDFLGLKPYADDIADSTNKRMDAMAKRGANAKGRRTMADDDEGDGKASKKAQKELEKEEKSLKGIIERYQERLDHLRQEVAGNKENNTLLDAQRDLQKLINIPASQRAAAMKQLNALHQEELELQKKKQIAEERDKLTDVLDNLKKQNLEMVNKNNHQEELKPLIEAEAKIRDLVKIGLGENLDLQKQIRDEAQKQVDLIKEQKHQDALDDLKAITDEYDKQNEALKLRLSGQEEYLPLLEQEKKIREDINLTDADKAAGIAAVRSKFGETQALNQALEDQKRVIDDVKDSSLNYRDKLASLDQALRDGRINTKQWTETVRDLYNEQKKTETGADKFAKTLVGGLEKAITSGKNFKSVLVDIGKQLALFAAQKLLLAPLENMISNLGNKMMGTGKYTPNPFGGGMGGNSGGMLASGGMGGSPYGMLNSMGMASGLGGLFGGGGSLGGMMGGGGGGGGPITQAYDRLYKGNKDIYGNPLQDLAYYTDIPGNEKLLGVNSSSSGGGMGAMLGGLGGLGMLGGLGSMFGGGGGLGSMFGGLGNMFGGLGSGINNMFGSMFNGINLGQYNAMKQNYEKLRWGYDVNGDHLMPFDYYTKLGSQGADLLGVNQQNSGGFMNALGGLGRLFGFQGFATGGNALGGTPFIAGEQGQELVVPSSDVHIYNAFQTGQIRQGLASALGGAANSGGAGVSDDSAWLGKLGQYWSMGNSGMENLGTYQQSNLDRQQWVKDNIDATWKELGPELRDVMAKAAMAEARNQISNAKDLNHWGIIQASQIAQGNFGPMGGPMEARTATLPDGDLWEQILRGYQSNGIFISDRLLQAARQHDQWTRVQMGNAPNQPLTASQGASMSMGFGMSSNTSFGAGDGGSTSYVPGYNDANAWGTYYDNGGGYDRDFGGASGFAKSMRDGEAINRVNKNSGGSSAGNVKNTGVPVKNTIPYGENPYGLPPFMSPVGDTGAYPMPDVMRGENNINKPTYDPVTKTWSDDRADAAYYQKFYDAGYGGKPKQGNMNGWNDYVASNDRLKSGRTGTWDMDGSMQFSGSLPGKRFGTGGRPGIDSPVVVGDRGKPELFWPDTYGSIVSGEKTEKLLNGGGDVVVHFNNNTGVPMAPPTTQVNSDGSIAVTLNSVAYDLGSKGKTYAGLQKSKKVIKR